MNKETKDKTLLWSSHRGDFCVRLPPFSSLSSLHAQLLALKPLFPSGMKRIFYCSPAIERQAQGLKTLFSLQFHHLDTKEPVLHRNSENELLIFCTEETPEYEKLSFLMEGGTPPSHLKIDLDAIQSNIQIIRSRLPEKTSLMAMVKARAYGTDEIVVSHLLIQSGINYLGVAHVEEALRLRRANIEQPIFVLHAAEYEMEKVSLARAEVGVYTKEQIHQANIVGGRLGKPLLLHLHVDTGMKRFGAPYSDILPLAQLIDALPNVELQGLFSHFPASDDPLHDTFSMEQTALFSKALSQLRENGLSPKTIHIANSAAIFRFSLPEATMARIGIALYGFSPSANLPFDSLTPALTLETTIAGLVKAKKGDTIGYGRRFQAPSDMTLAMLPLGYYDGLHRHHSGKQTVRIHQSELKYVFLDEMSKTPTFAPPLFQKRGKRFFTSLLPVLVLVLGDSIIHKQVEELALLEDSASDFKVVFAAHNVIWARK